ncbi:hypothetical protein PIB30_041687 [Stylosanthes scabra]|uniref:Uncharacterized protein n=1 Tax=Stylosanthes scabra TaxID=79078 RepID=A0ABU6UI58_9FABA|nr:hypothetical protein [Stylosanthes scabra]
MHCLCNCEKDATVWNESQIAPTISGSKVLTFWDFWRDKADNCTLGMCDSKELARIAIVCYGIWRARNSWVFEQVEVNPKSTMECCLKLFAEMGLNECPRTASLLS